MIGAVRAHIVQQSHSALHPASPQTHLIDRLWEAMYLTSIIVFVLVVAALVWAVFRRRSRSESTAGEPPRIPGPEGERGLTTAVAAATLLTVLILFGFLISDVSVGRQLSKNPGNHGGGKFNIETRSRRTGSPPPMRFTSLPAGRWYSSSALPMSSIVSGRPPSVRSAT